MGNNCFDNALYEEYGVVFGIFRHFSALNRNHARIKLACKVDYFRYYSIERGGLL